MLIPSYLQNKLAQIQPMANALDFEFRKFHDYNKWAGKCQILGEFHLSIGENGKHMVAEIHILDLGWEDALYNLNLISLTTISIIIWPERTKF